jgi:hypothetical protein
MTVNLDWGVWRACGLGMTLPRLPGGSCGMPPFTTGWTPHGFAPFGLEGLSEHEKTVISGRAVNYAGEKPKWDAKRETTGHQKSCLV